MFYKSFVDATKNDDTISYETIKIPLADNFQYGDELGMTGPEDKLATYSLIQIELSNLWGKVLTIVDAAVPQGKQNKSIKDLIKAAFGDKFMHLGGLLIDQEAVTKAANEWVEENGLPESVDIAVAMGIEKE